MHDRRRTNLRFFYPPCRGSPRANLEIGNSKRFHDRLLSSFFPRSSFELSSAWISVAKFRTSFRTRYGAWMLVKGKFTWHTASCVAPCTYTHTYIYTHQRIYRTPVIFQEDKSLVRREIFSRTFLTFSFFFFKLTVSLINQLCCR